MTALSTIITALTFFLMPAPTVLYSAELAPIATLPAGYFVMRTEAPAPVGYISVVYDDLTGFVDQASVTQTDYTPVTKYETTVKFTCDSDGQPVNLRASPQRSAEILKVLPATASGHVYGTLDGDVIIKGCGTLWYYVNADGIKGYVYGAHVAVGLTPANIIEKEEPESPPEQQVSAPQAADDMPTAAVIILIVALCIPVPIIMFYMFRKPKT